MRNHLDDLEDTRQSVDVFGEHPDDPLYERMTADWDAIMRGFYRRMFIEDASEIVPVPRMEGDFEVALDGGGEEVARLVAGALHYQPRTHRALTEAYYDFAERCAQRVVASGSAAYEIVYYFGGDEPDTGRNRNAPQSGEHPNRNQEESKIAAFRLMPADPYRRGPGGRHYQYVPSLETEDVILGKAERQPPRWIELDPFRLVVFTLPDRRRRQVERAWQGLAMADRFHGGTPPMIQSGDATGYDFEAHQSAAHETIAGITRDVGWNARMLFGNRQLEPYQLLRQLRWVRFKIELRDMITERLNEALAKAGQRMGFAATLNLRGVPTVDDVDAALQELQVGPSGKLAELYERFLPL